MSDGIVKRSVSIAGHRTSVSLEAPFWEALRRIAYAQGRSVPSLIGEIDAARGTQNLSSAIRVFVLRSVQEDIRGPERPWAGGRAPASAAGPDADLGRGPDIDRGRQNRQG
jgi:predicted DNA-binding ribbon-helix-helix protein